MKAKGFEEREIFQKKNGIFVTIRKSLTKFHSCKQCLIYNKILKKMQQKLLNYLQYNNH
jgi:hypothetical protein